MSTKSPGPLRVRPGMNLKFLLRTTGLSQVEVARLIGVSRACVSSWALGKRNPRPQNAAKLVAILGRAQEDIFTSEVAS